MLLCLKLLVEPEFAKIIEYFVCPVPVEKNSQVHGLFYMLFAAWWDQDKGKLMQTYRITDKQPKLTPVV